VSVWGSGSGTVLARADCVSAVLGSGNPDNHRGTEAQSLTEQQQKKKKDSYQKTRRSSFTGSSGLLFWKLSFFFLFCCCCSVRLRASVPLWLSGFPKIQH